MSITRSIYPVTTYCLLSPVIDNVNGHPYWVAVYRRYYTFMYLDDRDVVLPYGSVLQGHQLYTSHRMGEFYRYKGELEKKHGLQFYIFDTLGYYIPDSIFERRLYRKAGKSAYMR